MPALQRLRRLLESPYNSHLSKGFNATHFEKAHSGFKWVSRAVENKGKMPIFTRVDEFDAQTWCERTSAPLEEHPEQDVAKEIRAISS